MTWVKNTTLYVAAFVGRMMLKENQEVQEQMVSNTAVFYTPVLRASVGCADARQLPLRWGFMCKLIGFLLLSSSPAMAAEGIVGHYTAVTETEYLIDLEIQKGGRAVFELTIIATDEDDKDWHQTIAGSWSINGSILHIDLGNSGFVAYKADHCLSFEEFGFKGCGIGLKPIDTSTEKELYLLRYSLWKNDVLPKVVK